MVTVYSDYYINEVYVLRDAIEGVTGYAFLIAMTITSFKFGRQLISPKSWRWLHKGGIYFLWAYAYSVYWWEIFYYPGPEALDYIYFLMGFAACAVRFAAWRKKHLKKLARTKGSIDLPAAYRLGATLLVVLGLVTAVTSGLWREAGEDLLTGYSFTHIPETYLPYWPFEPFIPLILLALAAWVSIRFSNGHQSLEATSH
jgi:hypothetical protein